MQDLVLSLFCFTVTTVASVAAGESTFASDLERLLRGARIGVTFDVFTERHPYAVYSDADKRDVPVHSDTPGPLLITHETDPFLGLSVFANFGFKEAGLYEMVVVWTGAPETTHTRRRRFLSAAIERHGHAYIRETILVHPGTPDEQSVAVFCWYDADAVSLAFYTPPSPVALHPKGVFTYAQFTPGDPFLDDIFKKSAPTDAQRAAAWRKLADLLPVLEADSRDNEH